MHDICWLKDMQHWKLLPFGIEDGYLHWNCVCKDQNAAVNSKNRGHLFCNLC